MGDSFYGKTVLKSDSFDFNDKQVKLAQDMIYQEAKKDVD